VIRTALTLASLLALSASAATQSPVPLVVTGELLEGGGTVTGIGAVDVGFFGGWKVAATTDDPEHPALVLRSEGTPKKVGDTVFQPAGASIAEFGTISTEFFGGLAFVARLDGTVGGAEDNEAAYYENTIWLQKGPVLPWQGTNLPAGSTWVSFDDVRCASGSGAALFRGHHDDPTLAGPDETYLGLGTFCGSVGVLCFWERVVSEGELAPGLDSLISEVRVSPTTAAVSPSSQFTAWSCDLRGNEKTDGCVYLFNWPIGFHTLLAREGSPSPVAGRRWGPLESPALDVSSSGTWTMRATLDDSDPATDAVIVRNGSVLAREGDTSPAVAPDVFVDFGRGPALLDDAGRVVWYARLSGPDGPSEALFLDDEVLVRTGETLIGGRTLIGIDGDVDAMSLGPQGDLLVFRGTIAGGVEGAFAVDVSGL
jgi:hypothetical protein